MKGDEGIKLGKELTNFFLLSTVWNTDFCAQQVLVVKSLNRAAL